MEQRKHSTQEQASEGEFPPSTKANTKEDAVPAHLDPKIPGPLEEHTTTEAAATKLQVLEEQCKDFQDKYLRAKADLDNARKRFVKDKEDIRFQTICWVCLPLISIFDSFKMGMESAEKHHVPEDVLKGFQMIFQLFQAQLKAIGIEEINPVGEVFDPHFHEAVSQTFDDSAPEDRILQVVRSGYKLGDKLLRAASVIVSKGAEPKK